MRALAATLAVGALATLIGAAWLLPAQVDSLFWPGAEPDATFPRWLFLVLAAGEWVATWAVLMVAIPAVGAFRTLVSTFQSGALDRTRPSRYAPLATSSLLTAGSVWTAIAFPHRHLMVRSVLDVLLALVVVALGVRFVVRGSPAGRTP